MVNYYSKAEIDKMLQEVRDSHVSKNEFLDYQIRLDRLIEKITEVLQGGV